MSSTDPSVRKTMSSSVGSVSFIASGAYVALGLAMVIASVTWPLPVESPAFGVVLALAPIGFGILEQNEAMGGEPIFGGED